MPKIQILIHKIELSEKLKKSQSEKELKKKTDNKNENFFSRFLPVEMLLSPHRVKNPDLPNLIKIDKKSSFKNPIFSIHTKINPFDLLFREAQKLRLFQSTSKSPGRVISYILHISNIPCELSLIFSILDDDDGGIQRSAHSYSQLSFSQITRFIQILQVNLVTDVGHQLIMFVGRSRLASQNLHYMSIYIP